VIARRAAVIAIAALAISAPPVSAEENAETPSTSIAATVGAAGLATIMCWTMQIIESRAEESSSRDDDSKGENDDSKGEDDDSKGEDFDRRGLLIGLNGVYAVENFSESEEADLQDFHAPFEPTLSVGNSGGVSGRLGYRCNRRFSAEVQVEWIQTFEGKLSDGPQGEIGEASYSPIFTSINTKGYLLTGRFQPYLLFGAGTLNVDTELLDLVGSTGSHTLSKTMVALRFGGGIDVYATRHLFVNLGVDYVLPVTGVTNFEYISVNAGLGYRF